MLLAAIRDSDYSYAVCYIVSGEGARGAASGAFFACLRGLVGVVGKGFPVARNAVAGHYVVVFFKEILAEAAYDGFAIGIEREGGFAVRVS